MNPIEGPISDPAFYNAAALSIAGGDGYSIATTGGYTGTHFEPVTFTQGGDATAFWPPGFSFALGAAYAMFGESITVARTVNVIAGGLAVIPIYFIGRRLFGEGAGIAGAAIAAVLPSFIFWSPLLFSETMFTLVFASALALLLHSMNDKGSVAPATLVAAGLMTGLAALFRGHALLLLPMAVIWATSSGMRMKPALMVLLVMTVTSAIVITPWTVRNALQMDSPIILSANFGYNLRIGHAPYSTGRLISPIDLWEEEPGITFQEREILFNDVGRERAIEYALTHPKAELELAGRKIMWLWRPDSGVLNWFRTSPGTRDQFRLLLDTSYFSFLWAAAAGLMLGRSSPRPKLFVLSFVMLWTLTHIVFFGEPRFHIPILALLAPAAGAAVVAAVEVLRTEPADHSTSERGAA
jgi:4-amino-4-deoxy-L-arabinose transferase-like glycosyltransferase